MALGVAVGHSVETDSFQAGVMAAEEAMGKLHGDKPDLFLVFSAISYDQQKMLDGISRVAGNTPVVGCSTAGEITTDGPSPSNSVSVMAIHGGDSVKFATGVGKDIKGDERKAGRMVASEVLKQIDKASLRGFIMLPDGLAGNGAEIVRGVLEELGANFPVVGGSAGDDFAYKQTFQYYNDTVLSGDVVGVGLSGNFAFGVGVKHGWGSIGLPAKVTKATGNVLHELDGKPAITIYDKYFGQQANVLRKEMLAKLAITYPLGLKVEGSDEFLIRDPISVDESGSITCAAEIPEGSEIRLMIGSKESAVSMAMKAAEDAKEQLNGRNPELIIVFNCIARKKLFGESSGDEIRAIQGVLGRDVPLIGFYTYGEQAPLGGEVRNIERCNTVFHNETVVIYVIGE